MKKGVKFKDWIKSDGFFWLIMIIAIALIIAIGYYLFSYINTCDTKECFEKAVVNCKRVSWLKEDNETSWYYKILGPSRRDSCSINVKLLKLARGKIDSESLIGKEMICELFKGSTDFPEREISRCHGILKEDIQDVIIQRMHNYLLQNFGQLENEFEKF